MIRAASDPGAIREEIDATRQELGETIEALAEKTDMRAQAKHELAKMKAYVSEKTDALLGKKDYPLGEAVTSPASTASAANEKAPTNLVPLAAVGAFALGWVVGRRRSRRST